MALTIGTTQVKAIIMISDKLPSPNQRMKIGRKLIFGMGKATETSGSMMRRAIADIDISAPAAMPTMPALPKPATAQ